MKRMLIVAVALGLIFCAYGAWAQKKMRVSIATGGTGGVYYPYGGAIASVISKYVPGAEATAEVTAAAVDNLKLVGVGEADFGYAYPDRPGMPSRGKAFSRARSFRSASSRTFM